MSTPAARRREQWSDACLAARIFALDPKAIGGLWIIGRSGGVRERFLDHVKSLSGPSRRVPVGATVDHLAGGIDLAATLAAGRPMHYQGLIGRGGTLVLPMAERVDYGVAALLAQASDAGDVSLIALDERVGEDEGLPDILADRLGLVIALDGLSLSDCEPPHSSVEDDREASQILPGVEFGEKDLEDLAGLSIALGTGTRPLLLAASAARAMAALSGRHSVTSDDLAVAVRLVLGPRAVASPEIEEEHAPEDDRTPDDSPREDPSPQPENPDMVDREMSIDAARTNLPPGLLTALMAASTARAQTRSGAGARTHSSRKGRPAGSRPGRPAADARLDVIATLRAAIPWQKIRSKIEGQVIALRSDDFRVRRLKDRTESLTVFAVDASGSSAMARMSEAKGAVEVMLAEAYRRRDFVAVVAFRGSEAEILLPPTRALARAKRALGGLPGGGGTPLAAGLVEATRLAETARRRGQSPMIVALTDGKANVALTGSDNPSAPLEHAQTAARMVRTAGIPSVLIDTARRPQQRASDLAREMGARYVVMPASRPDDAVRAIRNEQ